MTVSSNSRSRSASANEDDSAERGVALLTAIFFMVLAAGLSVVVLSAILSQGVPARTAQKNTRTVYSAQAGLQNALSLIRSAVKPDATGKIFGDPAQLPCKVSGRVTGKASVGAYYNVTIQYFTEDPTDKDDAWRASASNFLACATPGGVAKVPIYAYVYSGGKDASLPATPGDGDRALSAVYKFKTSNVNIPGGMIYNSDSRFCLQAKDNKAGEVIEFKPKGTCTSTDLQLWIYSTDYRLKLASSTIGGAAGLCITGPKNNGGNTNAAYLDDCAAPTDPKRWNQLWSWTGDYSWRGQNLNIPTGPSNYCLSPNTGDGSPGSSYGQLIVRKDTCNGTFAPSSLVGAGAAGYNTHQLVNYAEFGRCADVTNEQINSSFMISYPCKQDPSGTGGSFLKWNHKWFYNQPPAGQTKLGPQDIHVFDSGGTKRCLTVPDLGVGNGDLVFKACDSSLKQQWTRFENTGNYASSYILTDTFGRCLFTDNSDPFNTYYSKVRVTACDGSLRQKWNAPAIYADSTFNGYREIAK